MFNNRVFHFERFFAPPWARNFFLVGAQISSLKLTLQRYGAAIAVHESCRKKIDFFQEWSRVSCVTSVIKQFGVRKSA